MKKLLFFSVLLVANIIIAATIKSPSIAAFASITGAFLAGIVATMVAKIFDPKRK